MDYILIVTGWLTLSAPLALWFGGLLRGNDEAEARADRSDAEDWP
jgi:hypothetical protein